MKYPKLLVKAATVTAALGFVLGASAAHADKVRAGFTISTDPGTAIFSYGLKHDIFKKAGLDIDAKGFMQSSQKYDIFKSGGLDIDTNMNVVNAAQLHSAGVPLKIVRAIMPADVWAVVVPKNSPLKKPADFKGKRFGVVSLSGTNYGVTYYAFKTAGVDLQRDMRVSALPPATLMTALERGEVDGATLYEPHLTEALKTGKVKMLFRPGDVYQQHFKEPYLALAIAVRQDFYDHNRQWVQKFIRAYEQAAVAFEKDPAATAQSQAWLMPDLKLSPAQIQEIMVNYRHDFVKQQNDAAFLKQVQSFYDRQYQIKQLKQPVKAADFWVKP